jgi:hypothetical protein
MRYVYVVVASGVWPQSYHRAERGSFDSEAEAWACAEAEMQRHREAFTVEKRLVPSNRREVTVLAR